MKKVVVFSLESIKNAGDQMLGDTTEFLIKQIGNFSVERKQLQPTFKQLGFWFCLEFLFANALKFIALKIPSKTICYRLYNIAYHIQFLRYYHQAVKNADYVIYAVGMLKYSTQNFSYLFNIINRIADKKKNPVLMSAMSIEKPNPNDWRYRQLISAVNLPCVRMITTRDGKHGLERLNQYYKKRKDIVTDYVGDPALWSPECYRITKNKEANEIGIGLIRTGIYEDYEKGMTSEQLYSFYKEMVSSLVAGGQRVVLFTNGMDCDMAVGKRLLNDLKLPSEMLNVAPSNARELVDMVKDFKVVFGARLHACITSVALGVPVSGLLWDNKLKFFSETMKISEYFTEVAVLTADNVINKINRLENFYFDIENRNVYKEKTLQSLKLFLVNN